MLHVRTLMIGVILSGCGSGSSQVQVASSSTPTVVADEAPSVCARDEAACRLGPFEDRSTFFEDVARERARLEEHCRVDPVACVSLAQSYGAHALRVPSDIRRAIELNADSCDAGDADGCWWAASDLLLRSDIQDASTRAAALLDRGCALGDAELCYLAGVGRLPNGELPHDAARALTQLRTGCERGHLSACVSLLRAGSSGLIEVVPPATVDALFLEAHDPGRGSPSRDARELGAHCGERAGASFYAPSLSALASLAPSSLTAPGAIAPNRLTVAIQRQITCTLQGAYGDRTHGVQPALRYLRVLGTIPAGLDVFVEWSDSDDDQVIGLHATRVHITPERLRVVADAMFEVGDADARSLHDTRLDVDGDGLRDVLVNFSQLAPGDYSEAFFFVASRGGGVSRVAIPNDTEAQLDGCFVVGATTPTLLLMETRRDAEHGWSQSCVAMHAFPVLERESVLPIAYTLGPRLTGERAIPALPPGGVPVLRERERPYVPGVAPLHEEERRIADSDYLPFAMCPERPVFLLRGHDGEQSVAQTVTDITRSERGSVGPGISPLPGGLFCEDFE